MRGASACRIRWNQNEVDLASSAVTAQKKSATVGEERDVEGNEQESAEHYARTLEDSRWRTAELEEKREEACAEVTQSL